MLFLDATDEILIRRFSETRRRHPLSGTDIRAGIAAERRTLARSARRRPTRSSTRATLNVHELRASSRSATAAARAPGGDAAVVRLQARPAVEADMVLDVRFLPNPYFVPAAVGAVGRGRGGRALRLRRPGDRRRSSRRPRSCCAVPCTGFEREGKSYATVAIGCTGGRHRSVAIAKELGRRLGDAILDLRSATATSSESAVGVTSLTARPSALAHVDASVVEYTAAPWRRHRSAAQVGLVIVTHGGCGECLLAAAADIVGPVAGVDRGLRRAVARRSTTSSGASAAPVTRSTRARRPDPGRRARLVAVSRLPGDARRHAAGRDRLRREPADADQAGDLRSQRAAAGRGGGAASKRWASGRSGWARS